MLKTELKMVIDLFLFILFYETNTVKSRSFRVGVHRKLLISRNDTLIYQ